MNFTTYVTSPLEQFEIISLLPLHLGALDISITNSSLMMILSVGVFVVFSQLIGVLGNGFLLPSRWQFAIESIYHMIIAQLKDNIGKKGDLFFPFVFTLFTFILIANLLGIIPYSFTVTSHIIVTFSLAAIIWIGKLHFGFRMHGLKLFGMFLPAGAPFILGPFLIILELISFTITVISLSVRLFANMMAGHILLKVLTGFAWTMMTVGGILYLGHLATLGTVFVLLGLETGVAFIQAYVFCMLTVIYLADMVSGAQTQSYLKLLSVLSIRYLQQSS
jgi:ATP synthase subunit 6